MHYTQYIIGLSIYVIVTMNNRYIDIIVIKWYYKKLYKKDVNLWHIIKKHKKDIAKRL